MEKIKNEKLPVFVGSKHLVSFIYAHIHSSTPYIYRIITDYYYFIFIVH